MIPLVVLICALLGGVFGGRVRATEVNADEDQDVKESLRLLAKVYSVVEDNYADPVQPDKAFYNGAIPGMVRTLDPHSNFVDPKAFQVLREERRGKYYGVGMTIGQRGGKTIVGTPFVGSPAYKAGLHPGDVITRVDSKSTEGLSMQEVVDLLKGAKGTTVHVYVQREGFEKPLEFTIVRDEIPRPSVDLSYEIRPGVGYIHVANFSETTTRDLSAALRKLDPKSLKGLVLDLRGNPGGLLSEAVSVADMFLAKGQVIVSHRGRTSGEKVYRASHGNGGLEYPLVVLINGQSASASEIVAGAIQDHDRGLVAGETSFGKGLVQNEYPLDDNTGLLLTIAKYYTPSGRLIQREFNGMSLYDYYYYSGDENQKDPSAGKQPREVRTTDSGRTVYGGGGITPDEKVVPPPFNPFQRKIENRYGAFFEFAKHYLAQHTTIPRTFEADDRVIGEFRRFLDDKKMEYTESELQQNLDYVRRRIKQELFTFIFGKTEGDRLGLDYDPQVLKAIELLPRAKQLASDVRRIVAQTLPQ
jgi:carboxyl-terminal processing protease